MSPEIVFNIHLILGYVAWLLCFRTYLLPRLKSMDRVEAHRAIATLHSFGSDSYFILPGVIGNLARDHVHRLLGLGDRSACYSGASNNKNTSAFLVFRLCVQSSRNTRSRSRLLPRGPDLFPALAGQFGATYAIPIIYVPLLMITHLTAFYWLLHPQKKGVRAFAGDTAAS